MNGYREIAKKIPDSVRKSLVAGDVIGKATAAAGDKNLQLLSRIWHEYIEPDREQNLGCGKCITALLANWRELNGALVELDVQERALKALSRKYGR